MEPARETPADRLRLAFDLIDFAERMLRQRLRREHPGLSEEQIEARVDAWYCERPGARDVHADGALGSWPRR